MRGCHELLAGLGQDIVPLRLHSNHRSLQVSASCIHHQCAHSPPSIGTNLSNHQGFLDFLPGRLGVDGKDARTAAAETGLADECLRGFAFGAATGGFSAGALALASCAGRR
jgi:hypothetical protein